MSAQDMAIHETYMRYAPAVFSISVEIPKEYIMERYEESLSRLRGYQERFSDLIAAGTDTQMIYLSIEEHIKQTERYLDFIKKQMLENNRDVGVGFAIDSKHLVTLNPVVRSATLGGKISLTNYQGKRLKASIKGQDPVMGIAVLEINDATLTESVDLDRAAGRLPIASYIMSIQWPYGLPPSPYSGMISGYDRQLSRFEVEYYIQTDLPLFPNNEGAPVFSPSGRLMGMMAGSFHVGDWPRVSFVIPAKIVADSAQQIIEHDGRLVRGWIPGASFQQHAQGILVDEIEPGSHASHIGLEEGDLIIGFQGREERELLDFLYRVMDTQPKESVRLDIVRDEKHVQLHVPMKARR